MNQEDILGFNLDEAYNTLKDMKVERGTIEKDLFVNVFAPYFLFGKPMEDGVLGKYAELTGGISIWVDIIDNGEIVDSIPPIINNGIIENAPESIDAISNKAVILNQRIPNSGDKVLLESFKGSVTKNDKETWALLREKYSSKTKIMKDTKNEVDDDDDIDSFLD